MRGESSKFLAMVNSYLFSKLLLFTWTFKGVNLVIEKLCILHYQHTLVCFTLKLFRFGTACSSDANKINNSCTFVVSAYCDGHLLVFSETHLDIFNTQTADWVQSIGLKRSRPLANHGNVAVTYINDSPMVIYLANMHTSA